MRLERHVEKVTFVYSRLKGNEEEAMAALLLGLIGSRPWLLVSV